LTDDDQIVVVCKRQVPPEHTGAQPASSEPPADGCGMDSTPVADGHAGDSGGQTDRNKRRMALRKLTSSAQEQTERGRVGAGGKRGASAKPAIPCFNTREGRRRRAGGDAKPACQAGSQASARGSLVQYLARLAGADAETVTRRLILLDLRPRVDDRRIQTAAMTCHERSERWLGKPPLTSDGRVQNSVKPVLV
jgi:hypothetical protein